MGDALSNSFDTASQLRRWRGTGWLIRGLCSGLWEAWSAAEITLGPAPRITPERTVWITPSGATHGGLLHACVAADLGRVCVCLATAVATHAGWLLLFFLDTRTPVAIPTPDKSDGLLSRVAAAEIFRTFCWAPPDASEGIHIQSVKASFTAVCSYESTASRV